MFLQVLEIDPEDALANTGLGEIWLARENVEKAKNYLEKAVLSSESSADSFTYLALPIAN